ncbi:MAG TPA: C25 family cysteine peptidase, partial [Ignavibacteriaceae bacterium]|nr:C25 family cysteine peptidase [Ignavibacteriaceae bacterium]
MFFRTAIVKSIFFLVFIMAGLLFSQPVYFNSNAKTGIEVNVLSSTNSSTIIEYIFNGYDQRSIDIKGKEYLFLSAPNMIWKMDKGDPQIPIFKHSIVIPDLAAIDYRILSNEVIEIPTRDIMPSKGHFTRNIDPMTVPYSFNKIYEKNVWYPSKSIELSDPYIVRDLRGMTIQFNPLSYNPLLNELRVNKKIVVEYFNDNLKESVNPFIRMTPFKGITKEYEDVYKTLFVNYSKGVHEYTPIPEPGKLLIIYNSVYATQIQQLYDWKVLKGIPTVLAEYPTATGTGATAIKNYILNMYNQPGSVTYIILVGESNQIPYLTGNYESAPSDPCYVKLVGSDAYPDAYISRISPTSTDNLAYIIKKIIKYERDPDTGVGSEWYHKAVGVASDEFGGTPLADWQRMDLIRDTLLNHGFISVDKIYDPGASGTMVANSVNAGRSLINYIGHGSGTSWSTTGFNVTQIKSLTNGYKNPFILDVACQ